MGGGPDVGGPPLAAREIIYRAVAMADLIVDFAGEVRRVADRMTFGRAADLELDSNPHLHRLVGEFARQDGVWWLRNLGSRLFLTMLTGDGTKTELAPGSQQVIVASTGVVRVAVGQARYELAFHHDGAPSASDPAERPLEGATTDFDAVLTPREIDFLVTFAQPILDGTNGPLPTYLSVASIWGVSPKTLDNTLQSIKRKMRQARLVRDEPLETLVRVAISHSLVTVDDLRWSDLAEGGARSSATGPRFEFSD